MTSTSLQCVSSDLVRSGVSGCDSAMLSAHSRACTSRSRCLRMCGRSRTSHSCRVRSSSSRGSAHASFSDPPDAQYLAAAFAASVCVELSLDSSPAPSPPPACFAKNHVVKQNRSTDEGSTLCSVFCDENSTMRPATGSIVTGSSGNGKSTSSPP